MRICSLIKVKRMSNAYHDNRLWYGAAQNPDYYKNDRHRCWGKIRWLESLGLKASHDEIDILCEYIWHARDASDFYRRAQSMPKEELARYLEQAKNIAEQKAGEEIKNRLGIQLNMEELDILYERLRKRNARNIEGVDFWLGVLSDVKRMSDEELKKEVEETKEELKRRMEERLKRLRRRTMLGGIDVENSSEAKE